MGKLLQSRLVWGIGALLAALLLYLAFAVFGVQTLFYDENVNEKFGAKNESGAAPAGLERISSGEFHAVAHPGTGEATVYRRENGSHVLRLENLDIFNGPDLYVYAVAAPDSDDGATVQEAGFLNLGRLKGNQGNQTYHLPANYDPEEHRSISVWCRRFSVNFAAAPLR